MFSFICFNHGSLSFQLFCSNAGVDRKTIRAMRLTYGCSASHLTASRRATHSPVYDEQYFPAGNFAWLIILPVLVSSMCIPAPPSFCVPPVDPSVKILISEVN